MWRYRASDDLTALAIFAFAALVAVSIGAGWAMWSVPPG